MADSQPLSLYMLGGFRINAGHEAAAGFDQARLRLLLAYLLLHRRAPVARHQLAFAFWPDSSDAQALNNLRTLLTRLRQALPKADRYIDSTSSTVHWRGDASWQLDVAAFEAAVQQGSVAAEQANSSDAIRAFRAAADLYTGDLLPGFYDEWLIAERERLRQAYLDALDLDLTCIQIARHSESAGQADRAIDFFRRAVASARRVFAIEEAVGYVYTSFGSATLDHPVPFFRAKAACEAALVASNLEFTILGPAWFMEIWLGMLVGVPLMTGQPISLIGKGDHKHNFVAEADVAAFAIAAVDNPRAANQRIGIGGPASFTWTEIVDAVRKVAGAPLAVNYLPLGSEVPLLPSEVSTLLNGMETFETFVDMHETAPAYGVRLTTLDEFIARMLAQ